MARRKKKVVQEEKPEVEFVPYIPPKLKFRKKGVSYKEGDIVEIKEADGVYRGELRSILSSQLVVRVGEHDKFFFQRSINISKVKS